MAAELSPDRAIDAIARKQHGVFTRSQARSAGFTESMMANRLRTGSWLRLAPSVYALPSHPFTWRRQAMAATLSVDGAVLSGRSAAALHQIEGFRPGRLEITAPPGRNARARLARIVRSEFAEATSIEGIPVLNKVDTLLSLAAGLPAGALERAVDLTLARQPALLGQLEDRFVLFARGRRKGTDAMRRILLLRGDGYVPPTSELERLLRSMLDSPDMPRFEYEVTMPWWPVGGGRVDAYNAACRLIVEADGRVWHARERDFVRDRRRDNLAVAHGHVVLRFTWSDLVGRSGECEALVRDTVLLRG